MSAGGEADGQRREAGRGRRNAWLVLGLAAVLFSADLALLPDGSWEQDEAMMAAGVVDFALARHTPHPPGFPGWIALGRVVRAVVGDPLLALRIASSAAHVGSALLLAVLLARIASPGVAWGTAALYGLLPGVWFHAPRGFSTTPALFFAVLAVWLWRRQRPALAALGWLALAGSGLVRPHLAPVLAAVSLLGVWRWRGRWGWLALGLSGAGLLVAGAALVVIHDTGGWERFARVTREHQSAHFAAWTPAGTGLAEIGVVRALGGVAPAAAWAIAWLAGLLLLAREQRGLALWLALVAAAAAWLLLRVHDPAVPRYAPALLCPMAAGVAALAHRLPRWVTAPALAASALAAVAFTAPAMAALARMPLPAVAAVREVAAPGGDAVLYHSQGLLPFVRLQQRTAGFAGEVRDERSLLVHGEPPDRGFAYLATPEGARMLSGPTVSTAAFERWPAVADRLALRRFRRVVLYRDGVLLGAGVTPEQCAGGHTCSARLGARALLYPQPGAAVLGLALEIAGRSSDGVTLELSQGGMSVVAHLGRGVHVVRRPLDGSPSAVAITRAPHGPGEEALVARLLAAWCEGEGLAPQYFSVSPGDPPAAARAGAALEGFFAPERFSPGARRGAWTGASARLVIPAGPGLLALRLVAPSPLPRRVTLAWEGHERQLEVGSTAVTAELAIAGHGGSTELEILSTVHVPSVLEPTSHDHRALGVVLLDVTFMPATQEKEEG